MHYFAGIVVILVGVILLLNNMGLTEISIGYLFNTYWPLILVYWGATFLIGGAGKNKPTDVKSHWSFGQILSGVLLIFLGVILIGNNLNLLNIDLSSFWKLFWPVIIIFVGISLLRGKVNRNTGNIAFMSGIALGKNSSFPLKSESYIAVMGGIEINLTKADIPEGETVLDLTAVMGGIEITIPEDLPVICEGMVALGGIDFLGEEAGGIIATKKMSYKVNPEAQKLLIIRGRAVMGGIEIRSR